MAQLLGSARGSGGGIAFAGSFSLKPWDWLRMLGPDISGNDFAGTHFGTSNYYEQTCYLDIVPLALFLLAFWWRPGRPVLRLAALAVGFFTLAAGRFLPPFYVAYFVLPGFRLFRATCRYTWFFVLLASMVSGLVLTRIGTGDLPADRATIHRRIGRLFAALAMILGAWALVAFLWTGLDLHTKPGAHTTSAWAALRAVALILATRAVLRAWLDGRSSPRSTVRRLLALTCLDLAAQWLPYRQSRPAREVLPSPTIVAALAAASPGRVLISAFNDEGHAENVTLANWGEGAGYDDLRGYNQAAPRDVLELLARADFTGRSLVLPDALGGFEPADWLPNLTGVSRIAVRSGEWPARWHGLPLEAEAGGWQVRRRTGALPRVWLAGAVERCSHAEALDRLPIIDPRRSALVEEGAAPSLPAGAQHREPAGSARLVAFAPDDVSVQVEATRPALLILADRFEAGWSVFVDDVPRPLIRADGVLRATEVAAGAHRVRFHYRAAGARGWYLTLATAILLLVGSLWTALFERAPADSRAGVGEQTSADRTGGT